MTVNTKTCIFVSLFLSRSMGLGNRTSSFDYSIDLSCWAIIMAKSWGELQLRPLSQDLRYSRREYATLRTRIREVGPNFVHPREQYCTVGTRIIEPRAKTSEIPSLGWGREHTEN